MSCRRVAVAILAAVAGCGGGIEARDVDASVDAGLADAHPDAPGKRSGPEAPPPPPPGPPQAIVETTVTPGVHAQPECQELGSYLRLGWFENSSTGTVARPIADGAEVDGGKVTVSCSVRRVGDALEVRAAANHTRDHGVSLTLRGVVEPTSRPGTTALGITASVASFSGRSFTSDRCLILFDREIFVPGSLPNLSGFVSCRDAWDASRTRLCESAGEIRFENCVEE